MNLLLFALTGAALAFLALAMPRHSKRVFRKTREGRHRGFRVAGWSFLALSLGLTFLGWRGGASLVAWFAFLSVHGIVLGLGIAYRPRGLPVWAGFLAMFGSVYAFFALAAEWIRRAEMLR